MTTCRPDCGQCCEVITLGVSQDQARRLNLSERDRRWITEELVPMRTPKALAAAPWQRPARAYDPVTGSHRGKPHYYRCTLYDPERRICTDHENRPDVCRLFPEGSPGWPNPHIALPPACAYHVDVGREPAPVPVRIERSSRA